jgi:hypothetical protein
MFANYDCARFFASEHSKNLRALAIETLAELHVRRDRLLPPIVFNVSVLSNVAHNGSAIRLGCAGNAQAVRMRYYIGNFPDA